MRSVTNIAKITSAMKMVAASKMRVAQLATENSRGISSPMLTLLGDHPGESTLAVWVLHTCRAWTFVCCTQKVSIATGSRPLPGQPTDFHLQMWTWGRTSWWPSPATRGSAAALTAQCASTHARCTTSLVTKVTLQHDGNLRLQNALLIVQLHWGVSYKGCTASNLASRYPRKCS